MLDYKQIQLQYSAMEKIDKTPSLDLVDKTLLEETIGILYNKLYKEDESIILQARESVGGFV